LNRTDAYWDLLTETRNNVKILKIEKGDIEYDFDQKVLKNANGGYLWECKLNLPRVKKQKK